MEQRRRELERLIASGSLDNGSSHDELEHEHVKTYRELINTIDALMVLANSNAQLPTGLDVVHDLVGHGGHGDENTVEYLEEMQQIRGLVMETSIRTPPILRAVHQVEGIPQKEKDLAAKIAERDILSQKIIEVQRDVDLRQQQVIELKRKNETLLEESRLLASQLLPKKQRQKETAKTLQLKQELQTAINKSSKFADKIQALVVEEGLDWYNDPTLKEIILLCGSIQHI